MYIGDLHIHSRYSRATSKDCTPEYLDLWARKKGIDIVGTGDFTHPAWREELAEKLEPAEEGLYALKEEYRLESQKWPGRPRFVVTGEISSIYKKGDRVRKVHSLLILPGLEDATALARRLELIGNVHSDGRPILGVPCKDLLEIMLETSPEGIYVPAHIWTPHFSLFGAFSGFDAIEECFEDLTPHIHALETGLSSDPPMNWRVGALDRFQLISNSDAHSPAKLGREANLLDIELSYGGLAGAIQKGDGLAGTIEFFPEEGKYHFDGHRKCGLCISPGETAMYGNRCPVCGKKITIGVLNRIEQLADREEGFRLPSGRPFESLVPLPEVIGASMRISATAKRARETYEHMTEVLGPEFAVLREIPIEDIRREVGPLVAEGIRRLRRGEVERTPGFDGEYGKIGLLTSEDISSLEGQISLFTAKEMQAVKQKPRSESRQGAVGEPAREHGAGNAGEEAAGKGKAQDSGGNPADAGSKTEESAPPQERLNENQREAVRRTGRGVAVIAGPGAGKTRTLIARLRFLLEERGVSPEEITAVTFTNKAAEEMRARMGLGAGETQGRKKHRNAGADDLWIGTFHAVSSRFLQEMGVPCVVADEGLQMELGEKALERLGKKGSVKKFLQELSQIKNGLTEDFGSDLPSEETRCVREYYQKLLRQEGVLDYDDLLLETLRQLEGMAEDAPQRKRFSYLLIDEFQDINPLQYRLVREWGRGGRELFVIGDPDQSIYGFRGCDPAVFSRLKEEYPDLSTIRLLENYRSSPAILQAALSVISHNAGEKRRMTVMRRDGLPVRIVSAQDERREAIFVAKEIGRQIGGIDMLDTDQRKAQEDRPVRGFSDIAVLYRTHRQAALLEKCFRQEGIPYVVAGREDFLTEPGVRAALYFFRHLLCPEEETDKLCRRLLGPILGEAREEKLTALIEKYRKRVRKARPVALLEEWANEFSSENGEAMKKLSDMSVLYPTMEAFLHTLFFGEDGDVRRSGGRKFTADAVTLMTIHGSKGLEFPLVFLYGMDKGRFPLEYGAGETDLEEERRLCYVGMTRAREELILVGHEEASVFLEEIPAENVRREQAGKVEEEAEADQAVQLSLFDFILQE
ncbi:MAG: UvrD-helicase domain-containing protein [Lachnospiraceae bacterium]|jgi:uncharacterized protein (TIGR00375 family)|nr:UvrD-helicase domain-containing protein [Lachnospiraceae bacterium]